MTMAFLASCAALAPSRSNRHGTGLSASAPAAALAPRDGAVVPAQSRRVLGARAGFSSVACNRKSRSDRVGRCLAEKTDQNEVEKGDASDDAPKSILQKALAYLSIEDDPAKNRSLIVLALVSHLWTVSNLMVVSVLPVYMRDELGLSNSKIGMFEGAAIAAAFFSKVFSGVISDMLKSRIGVISVGAVMTILVKPMFAGAGIVQQFFGNVPAFYWLFSGKIIDRLSKGVRGAPLDALIADLSSPGTRNRAFSVNYSFATFGGVVGSLACSLMMYLTQSNYKLVFILATLPAVLSLFLLLTQVSQPSLTKDAEKVASSSKSDAPAQPVEKTSMRESVAKQWAEIRKLPPDFYFCSIIVATLYMARFSESFVILRARGVGVSNASLPLLLTVNQLIQALLSYPMGWLADSMSSQAILVTGFLVLVAANAAFMFLPSVFGIILGFILIGVHMSMTQANTKSLLSSSLSSTQRGAGFAFFAALSGVSLAGGNILAGMLNDYSSSLGLGGVGCFWGGTAATLLATTFLLAYYAWKARSQAQKEASS
ncbi:putative MFS-type transporter [Porphyridium purpureum]|uniref:Putative MFS-type transporter n=1 Tax=Porphyridium purpureum TaxID=35688 RepID=A0A5J4YUN4_PORPP|nr:putative MFS-type transporter [Porphyridium purpureum]|eukprot:POR6332..scf227_4